MSVEVNSCEELHICNVNGKTAAICGLVGEYLVANRGINSLQLTVDGKQYESDEAIAEGTLDLICEKRENQEEEPVVTAYCSESIEIEIRYANKSKTIIATNKDRMGI